MHIVILQGSFLPVPPVSGGAVEKMWFKLGQEFFKLGHQVTHISREYSGFKEQEIINGVAHLRIPSFTAPKSMLIQQLFDAIYSYRAVKSIPTTADIIITNSFWSPVFLRYRKKYAVYVDVARMPKGQMWLYSKAQRLRANSNAVVDAIKKELAKIEHHRIGMIPNPLPFEAIEDINLSKKEKTILFCGRIHSEKGLELLAQSVSAIDLNGWKVQIVGPWKIEFGGSGIKYKNHLDECFKNSNVEFLGAIFDEKKLNEIYRKSAVFIYPSLAEKGETFGLAPLEAMAWSAVPIVSDLACFKDFIVHEKNGIIFNHRDKNSIKNLSESILRVINNTEFRNSLAMEAKKVNATHSTVYIAKQFIDDFNDIIYLKNKNLE